jgi:hypothetical protein
MAIGYFIAILVYVMAIGYLTGHFGIYFPIFVECTKKSLATLIHRNVK